MYISIWLNERKISVCHIKCVTFEKCTIDALFVLPVIIFVIQVITGNISEWVLFTLLWIGNFFFIYIFIFKWFKITFSAFCYWECELYWFILNLFYHASKSVYGARQRINEYICVCELVIAWNKRNNCKLVVRSVYWSHIYISLRTHNVSLTCYPFHVSKHVIEQTQILMNSMRC